MTLNLATSNTMYVSGFTNLCYQQLYSKVPPSERYLHNPLAQPLMAGQTQHAYLYK